MGSPPRAATTPIVPLHPKPGWSRSATVKDIATKVPVPNPCQRMVETNLLGAMTATEVFLDQLRDGGGDLVNISSVAGRVAPAGFAAYAATKWGINGWSEALRVELQPDIRVTVIEPGAITTELTDHITDPASKRANKTATAEMGIPAQDIADVIAFAISRPQRVTLNEILVRPTAQAM
jgi:NADP-dependent 3-hydroxy acid dehydrogenase YdfG